MISVGDLDSRRDGKPLTILAIAAILRDFVR